MKRRAGIAMFTAGVGLGVALVALLRSRVARPEGAVAPVAATVADLTDIKGIGPVYRERLVAAGITDLDALIAAGTGAVAEAADVVETAASDWIAQATALSGAG
jgi:predicted flap endonuclease-1-like 5' DNA nuclease